MSKFRRKRLWQCLSSMNKGLYIHIPFCLSKCPYCDFYSVAYDGDTANRYKDAVIRNLRYYLSQDENLRFDTVYFLSLIHISEPTRPY